MKKRLESYGNGCVVLVTSDAHGKETRRDIIVRLVYADDAMTAALAAATRAELERRGETLTA